MPETIYLSDPRTPLGIEYSAAAMQQIRERARDGLMAAPRVAFGVGGLLLGVRDNHVVRLLDSIDIPCSHSTGPSFQLNTEELRETREMIAEVEALSGDGRVSVVGYYCSKTRGDARLSETDLGFFDELFPAPGQIGLVVRPNAVGPMRAAFFFRDESGAIADGPEGEIHDWRPEPAAEAATVPEEEPPAPVVDPPPPELPRTDPPPAAPKETTLADILQGATGDLKPTAARQVTSSGLFGVPGLEPPRPRRGKRQLIMATGAAAALFAAVGAAYVTRNDWLPKPPLALTSADENGSLLIRWNPDALRGVEHASLLLNDGGQQTPSVVPLDRSQLISGLYIYMPKSLRVTAKLDAGETTGITAWFAAPPKPAAPLGPADTAQAPVAAPAPAAPLAEAKPKPVLQTHPAQEEAKPKP
jgi:hypothetical protein